MRWPDLTVAKSHAGNFPRGGSGSYTVTVTNSGDGVTSGAVTVSDVAPGGVDADRRERNGLGVRDRGANSDMYALHGARRRRQLSVDSDRRHGLAIGGELGHEHGDGGGRRRTGNGEQQRLRSHDDRRHRRPSGDDHSRHELWRSRDRYDLHRDGAEQRPEPGADDPGRDRDPGRVRGRPGDRDRLELRNRFQHCHVRPGRPARPERQCLADRDSDDPARNGGRVHGHGNDQLVDAGHEHRQQHRHAQWSRSTAAQPPSAPRADLSLTKTAASATATSGEQISYALAVSNGGPDTAQHLTLTDTLPSGMTFVSATGDGWACTNAGAVTTCTRAQLGSGATTTVTLVATAAQSGAVTNSATVGSETYDPNPGNGVASAVVQVADKSSPPNPITPPHRPAILRVAVRPALSTVSSGTPTRFVVRTANISKITANGVISCIAIPGCRRSQGTRGPCGQRSLLLACGDPRAGTFGEPRHLADSRSTPGTAPDTGGERARAERFGDLRPCPGKRASRRDEDDRRLYGMTRRALLVAIAACSVVTASSQAGPAERPGPGVDDRPPAASRHPCAASREPRARY